MPNLFEVLSLACGLSVSNDEIDAAWRIQSQNYHPDLAGEEGVEISSRVNDARDTLLKASGRLAEWLRVKASDPGSRTASLSGELMNLFSEVGDSLREADETILSLQKTHSALAKSLLAPRAIAAQKGIQGRLAKISGKIEEIRGRFPEFEDSAENKDFRAAIAALGELKFLEKWQRECQQRLLALLSMD